MWIRFMFMYSSYLLSPLNTSKNKIVLLYFGIVVLLKAEWRMSQICFKPTENAVSLKGKIKDIIRNSMLLCRFILR